MNISDKASKFTENFLGEFSEDARAQVDHALAQVEHLDGGALFVVFNPDSRKLLAMTGDAKQAATITALWLSVSNTAAHASGFPAALKLSQGLADIAIGVWDKNDKELPVTITSDDTVVDYLKFKVLFPFIAKNSVVFSIGDKGQAIVAQKFRRFGDDLWGAACYRDNPIISSKEVFGLRDALGVVVSLSIAATLSAINEISSEEGKSVGLVGLWKILISRAMEESDDASSSVDLSGFTNGSALSGAFKDRAGRNPFKA